MSRRRQTIASALCAALWAFAPAPAAQAYPIDCAILLCMAGGFPASVECSRAKAEVIRRITPWPGCTRPKPGNRRPCREGSRNQSDTPVLG